MTLGTILAIAALWLLASAPIAVLVGTTIRRGDEVSEEAAIRHATDVSLAAVHAASAPQPEPGGAEGDAAAA